MKTYAIEFQSVNAFKEKITCTSLTQAESLFLSIHSFEEQNRGRGYVIISVREENTNELSAIKSLKANVRFWFHECGLSTEEVFKKIAAWGNFAFSPKEQGEAKKEVIEQIRKHRL